ncbi:MAG TPA: HD domain-containing phosphohydrolase [Phycisphaerae bacterium]|nr:HD domain-containing phosphohydrolase [Phycisphaerae bacterium]
MTEISTKILCIDDEPNVLSGIQRQLRGAYDVAIAIGAKAGLETLQTEGPFAVIISDYMMPEMNGIEVLKEAGRLAPDTIRIMLTGCAELDVAVSALNEGHIWRFLSKPCTREALQNTLREALEHHRLIMVERRLTQELNGANQELQRLNAGLEERVKERTALIQRMHRFVSQLSGLDTIEDMAGLIVRTTGEMLKSRRVSLMLPDLSGEYLTIAAAIGIDSQTQGKIRVPVGTPIAGLAYSEGRCISVNEPGTYPSQGTRYDGDFFAVVPMVSKALTASGKPVAVLNVTEHEGDAPYTQELLTTLETIAESSAMALQNQIRLQERNEARDAIILALAKLAEHRDPETGAHLERVQIYCRLLSEGLAKNPRYAEVVDHEFISAIVRSSPLHDVGKVGIPDSILLKPARLTPEEFEVMKTHTTIGGETIRAIVQQRRRQSFLQMGMEIAYYHHERYDGSGYPSGLKGDDIPLPARILAVADVYDAMVSARVYKAALSHEEALSFIGGNKGTKFDPQVVEVFLDKHEEFRRIHHQLLDKVPARPPKSMPCAPVSS